MKTDICRDLSSVHPTLVRKAQAVLTDVNAQLPDDWKLCIFETFRSPARQLMLFQQGKSKIRTARGKHCQHPAEAVDVVFQHHGQWTWESPYWQLVDASAVAHNLRRIAWDKPHLELKAADR
jgi:hypothetical protein